MESKLSVAVEAVAKAGTYLRKQFLNRHEVSWKEDKTVLLGEDIKSDNMLRDVIHNKFPSDSFLTEESDNGPANNKVWIIDPLCGSLSYLRGVETWSISVAYVENGAYQLGVVYIPLLDYLFTSEKEKGAYLNGRKITPSKISALSDAFVSVQKLISSIKRIRVGHGSGGELGYVAAGFLDALIKTEQTIEHFSGGRVIAEEAGALFLDFTGNRVPILLDKKKKINYIACTPKLKESLLTFVKDNK